MPFPIPTQSTDPRNDQRHPILDRLQDEPHHNQRDPDNALLASGAVHGTAVLSGVIWALWHVPIIVYAGYNAGTGWYGLAVVSANMIGLCFVVTWLRLKSGTLWTGVILHASSNHFIPTVLRPRTAYTGRTKYILGQSCAARKWPNLSRLPWKHRLLNVPVSAQTGNTPGIQFGEVALQDS